MRKLDKINEKIKDEKMNIKFKKFKIILLIAIIFIGIILILISFINKEPGRDIKKFADIANVGKSNITVYFCPEDLCPLKLDGYIDKAENSVYCTFLYLKLNSTASSLINKYKQGIDVKIITDLEGAQLEDSISYQTAEYIPLKLSDNKSMMHNNFCIFDNKSIWISSGSPTYGNLYWNDDAAILIEVGEDASKLVENYNKEFDEMWTERRFGKDKTRNTEIYVNEFIENRFCPEDDCQNAMMDYIKSTKSSLDCVFFSFTLENIRDEVIKKHFEGVNVRIILEQKLLRKSSAIGGFYDAGVPVIVDKNPHILHAKWCVSDGKTVYFGSVNPSVTGTESSSENLLFIKSSELAMIFERKFDEYWEEWK